MDKNNKKNNEDKKKKDEEILEHEFDGIKEKNTPIPLWFNAILYGSIIFAVVYFAYYHIYQDGQSLHHEEALSMGKVEDKPNNSVFDYAAASKDAKILADAKTVYNTNCASCHGLHGEGGVGPNLTDDYWIHGDTFQDVGRAIAEGFPEKGMPGWKSILGEKKVNELVAYIGSIQLTNPANGKAPEGKPGKLH